MAKGGWELDEQTPTTTPPSTTPSTTPCTTTHDVKLQDTSEPGPVLPPPSSSFSLDHHDDRAERAQRDKPTLVMTSRSQEVPASQNDLCLSQRTSRGSDDSTPVPVSPPPSSSSSSSRTAFHYGTTVRERNEMQKKSQQLLKRGMEIAQTKSLKKALEYLIAMGLIKETPRDVSSFLRIYHTFFNEADIGDYLGEGDEEFKLHLRLTYARAISFTGMSLVDALRHYLTRGGFKLPGEAQKIARMVEAFAQCYYEDTIQYHHPSNDQPCVSSLTSFPAAAISSRAAVTFSCSDTVMILSYSIIMLNTDLHNPQVKKNKMSKEQFIKNNRGIDSGNDVPKLLLESIYDDILKNPIQLSGVAYTMAHPATAHTHASDRENEKFRAHLSKSVAQSEDLMKDLARYKYTFNFFGVDASMSPDLVKILFERVWFHFLALSTTILGNYYHHHQTDVTSFVLPCLDMLRYCMSTCLFLEMHVERQAFSNQLAKMHAQARDMTIPHAQESLKELAGMGPDDNDDDDDKTEVGAPRSLVMSHDKPMRVPPQATITPSSQDETKVMTALDTKVDIDSTARTIHRSMKVDDDDEAATPSSSSSLSSNVQSSTATSISGTGGTKSHRQDMAKDNKEDDDDVLERSLRPPQALNWLTIIDREAATAEDPWKVIGDIHVYVNKLKESMETRQTVETLTSVTKRINRSKMFLHDTTHYIREGDLVKKCRTGRHRLYRFFLFNDQLLYADKSSLSGNWNAHQSLRLRLTRLADVPDTLLIRHAFQILNPVKTFTVLADTLALKVEWMRAIEQAIIDVNHKTNRIARRLSHSQHHHASRSTEENHEDEDAMPVTTMTTTAASAASAANAKDRHVADASWAGHASSGTSLAAAPVKGWTVDGKVDVPPSRHAHDESHHGDGAEQAHQLWLFQVQV
jgi:hypothetical protein